MPAIKPNEVLAKVAHAIPDYVIEVFNDLIKKSFNGYSATVKLEDAKVAVTQAIVRNNPEIPHMDHSLARQFMEERRYMDVEPVFRDAGWKVEFNKKCIGDNFDSHFVFKLEK